MTSIGTIGYYWKVNRTIRSKLKLLKGLCVTVKADIVAGRKSCKSCEIFFENLKEKVAYI